MTNNTYPKGCVVLDDLVISSADGEPNINVEIGYKVTEACCILSAPIDLPSHDVVFALTKYGNAPDISHFLCVRDREEDAPWYPVVHYTIGHYAAVDFCRFRWRPLLNVERNTIPNLDSSGNELTVLVRDAALFALSMLVHSAKRSEISEVRQLHSLLFDGRVIPLVPEEMFFNGDGAPHGYKWQPDAKRYLEDAFEYKRWHGYVRRRKVANDV